MGGLDGALEIKASGAASRPAVLNSMTTRVVEGRSRNAVVTTRSELSETTVSVGAAFPRPGDFGDEVAGRPGRALYEAKGAGRDRKQAAT